MSRALAFVSITVALLLGCGGHATYVKASDATLGRVVVYRNGIAYFERQARVTGDELTLRVPADKVDDFLKSLSVIDRRTGKALPISFPTRRGSGSGEVTMTIKVGTQGPRDVALTYVTESPAWKPSYRLAVAETGEVTLQGWAIVDNTSGEDWRAVRVGVGSSSALSFRFDLHSVRMVHRQTLRTNDTFAKAPPRGGSVVREERAKDEVVLGDLSDGEIPRQAGHPDSGGAAWAATGDVTTLSSLRGGGGGHGRMTTSTRGKRASRKRAHHYQARRPAREPAMRQQRRLAALADKLKQRRGRIVIEGYARAGEGNADDRALDRANTLRNQLIMMGVPPAQVAAVSRGVKAGRGAGVRIVEQTTPAAQAEAKAPKVAEDGGPVGESHFESGTAMTVPRGTSAMVSIVQSATKGDVVYLYDPESTAGNSRFAFKAVRFRNPTASMLETGPVTVYGNGRFIGEGLTDAIPPHAVAVVPFALDRQVVVERDQANEDRIARLIKLHRGVLTAEVQHLRRTKLKIVNRLGQPALVLVRHTVRQGWELVRQPKVAEKLGRARLFQVQLAPRQTRVVVIEEATPMQRTLDLRSPVGIGLVRVYLSAPHANERFREAMQSLLAVHATMTKHLEEIESLRQQGDEYRQRLNELHVQIVSLKAVKATGPLMRHLQTKMKEISQRVQANTIAVVDHQEQVMIAKVRFHEGLSELTLEEQSVATGKKGTAGRAEQAQASGSAG